MGKDKGGIWGTQEKKKGGGGKKGPPSALDDDDGPKLGKKEAAAKAKMEQQMAALKEKGVQSMDCRHILVEKHSDAVKILTSINNGEIQFNEAARQHSIDKAGKCGLLGWMTKDQLDPAFWAAALEIPEGMYSPEPVRTQWGYHIIKIEGRK
mmetsp:Transcript_23129/g.54969  ORF Transcript_23129/g.54969 Transcript_23129/m.54969 type:complete len:152 (+) Transcript_23129:32-487(+)